MKDKLRELAERWRRWTDPVDDYEEGFEHGQKRCAEELLSILDADGDGGAAWWTTKEGAPPITSAQKNKMFALGYPASHSASHYNVPLYTHPARSGVVSDEDVSVVAKMIANRVGNGMREKYEELAKQIAEHFAAIAQEKQS